MREESQQENLNSLSESQNIPLRIVAVYIIFGVLWIIFSDLAVSALFSNETLATKISIFKGILFILVSAGIVFILIRGNLSKLSLVEKQLLESEAKFRSIVELSPMAVYLYHLWPDGKLILRAANQAADKFTGISHRELLGKTIEEAFPNLKNTLIPDLYRKIACGESDSQAFEIPYQDDRFSGYYDVHVFRTTQNAIAVLYTEISDRKRTEEELRQLKDYLSNIIDSMPVALVGVDNSAVVVRWNKQADRLLNLSSEEAIGKPVDEVLPDFAPWMTEIRTSISEHQPAVLEKLQVQREGQGCFFDLLIYPLVIDSSEGAVIRIEDITEKTRIQDLLVQTEKMISISGLAGGMAHELNNPLGVITQAAQNIERRISPEIKANRQVAGVLGIDLESLQGYFNQREIFKFIEDIRSATARAAKIIANMLQFSRRSESIMERTSLCGILDRALEIASSDYDLKKKYDFQSISIVREYEENIPALNVVPVEIEQVVLNLLRNAGQALASIPDGRKAQITLRLKCEAKYVVIEVEDNGPGMEEKVRRRVFEPFFTTKEPGAGTGLGLSVSYTIVTRNHKGLMSVESSPGNGACFSVRLPLVES